MFLIFTFRSFSEDRWHRETRCEPSLNWSEGRDLLCMCVCLFQAWCPRPRCAYQPWSQWARWQWSTSTCWSRACWDLVVCQDQVSGSMRPCCSAMWASCSRCVSCRPVWCRRRDRHVAVLPMPSGSCSCLCSSSSSSSSAITIGRSAARPTRWPERRWLCCCPSVCPPCFSSWRGPTTWRRSAGSRRCGGGSCGWWWTCWMCWTCRQGCGKPKEVLQGGLEGSLSRGCPSGPRAWSSFTATPSCCCCRVWPSQSWEPPACQDRGGPVRRLCTLGSAWSLSTSSPWLWEAQACCGTGTPVCPPCSWGRTCWLWAWSWAQPGRNTSRSALLRELGLWLEQNQETQPCQARARGKERARPRGKSQPLIITHCLAPRATLSPTSAWSPQRRP